MNEIPTEAMRALDQLVEVVRSPKLQREIEHGIKQQQRARKIAEVFTQTTADGGRRFTKEQVGDVIALTVIGSKGAITPTGPLTRVLAEFFKRIGVRGKPTPKRVHRAIDSYLERNPPRQELLMELRKLVKEDFAGVEAESAARSFRLITGSKTTQPRHVEDRAPEGARGLDAVADQVMLNIRG